MECTHLQFYLIVTRLSSHRELLLELTSFHLKFSNLGWVLPVLASWGSRSWGSCQIAACILLLIPAHLPCLNQPRAFTNSLSILLAKTRPCCYRFTHSCLEWFAGFFQLFSWYCLSPSELRGTHSSSPSPYLSKVVFHNTSSRVHPSQSTSSL